jgi:hypothetical protein
MHDDEILREVHQVKEQLSAEFQRDPNAYWAELQRLAAQRSTTVCKPAKARSAKPKRPLKSPAKVRHFR